MKHIATVSKATPAAAQGNGLLLKPSGILGFNIIGDFALAAASIVTQLTGIPWLPFGTTTSGGNSLNTADPGTNPYDD